MATTVERNKILKLLDKKGYDSTLIENHAPLTVEINRYQKYGELLKNLVESYPRDKIVLVMKDTPWIEPITIVCVHKYTLRTNFAKIRYSYINKNKYYIKS